MVQPYAPPPPVHDHTRPPTESTQSGSGSTPNKRRINIERIVTDFMSCDTPIGEHTTLDLISVFRAFTK